MTRVVAYDLCRLFVGPWYATPRGIDRVDLAVARHVFADPDAPHLGILPTPLGVRAYPARTARRLLDHLQVAWGEDAADDRAQRRALIERITMADRRTACPVEVGDLTRSMRIARCLALMRSVGLSRGQAAARAVPPGAVYLCMGQQVLAVPMFFAWLGRRPDVACAMMLHDTIPLDHPELVRPASVAHHARMLRTAAARADALIFSTAFARASVTAALAALGHRPVASLVRTLPVAPAFAGRCESLPELAGLRYFVIVSTIEPRKNVALLLRVWERLLDRLGEAAPHLVIVGAPGLDAAAILAPLAASPRLRARVHQVVGLTSPTLARLIAGCTALLSPSLAEGFGLPLLEGVALDVPTIASDIPSHREIAGETTVLLDPGDVDGWEAAVRASPPTATGSRRPVPIGLQEPAYAADIMAFVQAAVARVPTDWTLRR